MSGRCGHENAEHMMPGDVMPECDAVRSYVAHYEHFRCLDCGAWLPLGHSDETPERVAVEIRAAEIAMPFPHRAIGRFTDERQYEGWWLYPSTAEHWGEEEWAGYLAACIAFHKDETP